MALESFRGDFASLAGMMDASWRLNKEPALLFNEAFLRSAFEYPGSTFDLAPAIYTDSGIAGFCAAFPRNVRIDGRDRSLAVSSFLTVSSGLRGAGHGIALWGEIVDRVRAAGYDGIISFCVDGDDMHRMMPVLGTFLELNSQTVYKVEYLTRFLRPEAGKAAAAARDTDIEMFLELAADCPDDAPLARLWTHPEAVWQCRERCGAITVSLENEGRRGLLTGYVMNVVGNPPVPVALIDDLLWGSLNSSEQVQLLQRFLSAAASNGARSVSCPVMGYSSTAPLTAQGFRPSRRVIHTWLTLWNGPEPRPVSSLYIDVF
jgi:GNAT superfamily N-acetyltransferase